MRILGMETSGPRAGIALLEGGQLVAGGEVSARGRIGEKLTDLVDHLLVLAGWEHGSLDRIAVDVGPGSFTGLRIGLALAKGLSLGSGVPVAPVSSLRALALAAPGEGAVLASLTAPRGMVYAAVFAGGAARRTMVEEALWRPSELWELLSESPPGRRLNVLGPMADVPEPGGKRWDSVLWPHARPTGRHVALIGSDPRCTSFEGRDLAGLVPRYLRGADVRQPESGAPTQTAP